MNSSSQPDWLAAVVNAELNVLQLFAPTILLPPMLHAFAILRDRPVTQSQNHNKGHERLQALPPMPQPRRNKQCLEQVAGSLVITSVVSLLYCTIVAVEAIADSGVWWCQVVGWHISLAASACLFALQHFRPGVIQREERVCFPLPKLIAERMRTECIDDASGGLSGAWARVLANIGNQSGDDGREYCVRCMVWRPARGYHHCSTCNRCVPEFDYQGSGVWSWAYSHHCRVTGTCIYGTSMFSYNMWIFKLIIGCAAAGSMSMITSVLLLLMGDAFELMFMIAATLMGASLVLVGVRWAESAGLA